MQSITEEAIFIVFKQVQPSLNPHATTVAYLKSLLSPFASAIEPAISSNSIEDWIAHVLPGNLAKHGLSEATKAKLRKMADLNNNDDEHPEVVNATKNAIIEYLAAEICEVSGNKATEYGDQNIILPWDVLDGCRGDEELSAMLGLMMADNTLPVTVVVSGQEFTHMMSSDLAMGILVFSSEYFSNYDYKMSILGVNLENNLGQFFGTSPGTFRYLFKPDSHQRYSVKISVNEFTFATPEFIQGFLTGASWVHADVKEYLSDLKQYTKDQYTGVETVTELAF